MANKNVFSELFTNLLKDINNSFENVLSIGSGISFITSQTKEAVSELKDLNSVLTEIGKSTSLTSQQIKELGESAFDTASKYGKAASDYLSGMKEMYHAGFYNMDEMAELSILAQTAGDLTSDVANKYLIATDAAYHLKGNIKNLNAVLDSQNYLAKNSFVSMDDMAQATSEAASAAAQYGIQVDELSSLIAAAASKTHASGSETGIALTEIFENLHNISSESVQEALDSVNISMIETVHGSKQLKTPIQMLKELSTAFVKLDKNDSRRADILSSISSEDNSDTLSAILSDWSSYEKMLEYYSNGAGTAMREAMKNADNWKGSLNRLSNTWTDTVGNFANSDAILTAIHALDGLLSGINQLTDGLESWETVGLGASIAGITAFFKNFACPCKKGIIRNSPTVFNWAIIAEKAA